MNDLERSHAECYRLTNGRILLFNIWNNATVQPFTSVYLCQKSELRPSPIALDRATSTIVLCRHGVVSKAVRRITAAKRVSIPLLGCWFAAWVFAALAMGTEAGVSSVVAPILQSEAPRAGPPETPLAAELLSLIKQLDPLRVTIPYVDYHDEAMAAQTTRRKLQRRAGFKRSRARRNSFKASSGWTVKGSSVAGARGRSRSSRR